MVRDQWHLDVDLLLLLPGHAVPYPLLVVQLSDGPSLITTFFTLPMWVHLAVIGLWAPQLMWFNRMLKGSIKVIKEQMARMEDKKKPKHPVVLKSEDSVLKSEDSVLKSKDSVLKSEDSDEKLCQKLD